MNLSRLESQNQLDNTVKARWRINQLIGMITLGVNAFYLIADSINIFFERDQFAPYFLIERLAVGIAGAFFLWYVHQKKRCPEQLTDTPALLLFEFWLLAEIINRIHAWSHHPQIGLSAHLASTLFLLVIPMIPFTKRWTQRLCILSALVPFAIIEIGTNAQPLCIMGLFFAATFAFVFSKIITDSRMEFEQTLLNFSVIETENAKISEGVEVIKEKCLMASALADRVNSPILILQNLAELVERTDLIKDSTPECVKKPETVFSPV